MDIRRVKRAVEARWSAASITSYDVEKRRRSVGVYNMYRLGDRDFAFIASFPQVLDGKARRRKLLDLYIYCRTRRAAINGVHVELNKKNILRLRLRPRHR